MKNLLFAVAAAASLAFVTMPSVPAYAHSRHEVMQKTSAHQPFKFRACRGLRGCTVYFDQLHRAGY